jgi:hypothetical protein
MPRLVAVDSRRRSFELHLSSNRTRIGTSKHYDDDAKSFEHRQSPRFLGAWYQPFVAAVLGKLVLVPFTELVNGLLPTKIERPSRFASW